jgi:mannitol operon transcriptional antiterminator
MGLPLREIRLIEVLLHNPEGLTADVLADRLGVSARTVHRDLQPASEFLASRGLTLVRRAGQGVRVEGPASARARTLEAPRYSVPRTTVAWR